MIEHYITLFDSFFLPQGLALYLSMERHIDDYCLWIICVDNEAYHVLTNANLKNTRILSLAELETDELLSVKPYRTRGEYCWTLTPFSFRFVFELDRSVQRVTYIDADIWFLKNPYPIFDEIELSGKSVLITEHAYAPSLSHLAGIFGRFCVQFLTMYNNYESEVLRKKWEKQCLEWCYCRAEENKFGDQKYLDLWPLEFPNVVHILRQKFFAMAPWNALRFDYQDGIFFHFHGLRITSEKSVNIGEYYLPESFVNNVYQPYLLDLRQAVKIISRFGGFLKPQALPTSPIRKLISLTKMISRVLRMYKPRMTLKW